MYLFMFFSSGSLNSLNVLFSFIVFTSFFLSSSLSVIIFSTSVVFSFGEFI